MSGPFAIAAVTAVLKDLLNDGITDHDLSALGNVAVTALPPDRIPVTSADEPSQLNLFLFQVSPNLGWRNVGLPSRGTGGERLTNPPLALDLHYLVTAYGREEFHAEVLLGYAMQLLHEVPVLTRAMVQATLNPALPVGVSLPPGLEMLATSDLADQVELVKITPEHLDTEAMSRLWSAMQAKYRPTAVYRLSVVLIEAGKAAKAPLPVLRQGDSGRGPNARGDLVAPFPTIDAIVLPAAQTQARPGDELVILGHDLSGDTGKPADVTVAARLTSLRLGIAARVAVPPADRSAVRIAVPVPDQPAGVYALDVEIVPNAAPSEPLATNSVALVIAPTITGGLGALARTAVDPASGLGTATIGLTCTPQVLPAQRVSLVIGAREVMAAPRANPTSTLAFVATGLAAGDYRVRLRVDGGESLLVDRSDPAGPRFDDSQMLVLS